ncbi:hypothetical protein niasHS_015194 [Heterodera schachtii]|uniref:Uncharacterized protein n=2 Tax=Heterodera TaxID=34509 RepID=A0ABD2I2Q6_HETSC
MIANFSEQTMDWTLAKGCEMAEKLWEKAKLGTKTANECVGEEMGQKMIEMCAGGTSKAKEIAQNWGKSALIATGQCVLAQMQTKEEQIEEEQNAEGMAKLGEFDASFKECAKALAPEQKAKSGIGKLLKAKANQQLKPSDLVNAVLKNKEKADDGKSEGNDDKKSKKTQKNGKLIKLEKRKGKGKGNLEFYPYMGMIVVLFFLGQQSLIASLLLLCALPWILRPKNSD